MSGLVSERGWQLVLLAALVVATLGLLAPGAAVGVRASGHADKLAHVLLFTLLGLLGRRAYPGHPRWRIFLALILYGAAIELAQSQTGRSPEAFDLVADAVGAAVVWVGRRAARREG
jgi:VanZ family protein